MKTVLMDAINDEDFDAARRLIGMNEGINSRDENGKTPLIHFLDGSNISIEFFQYLLEKGVDVNCSQSDGISPLHIVSSWARGEWYVDQLIKAGANVNSKSDGGLTPLHIAAACGVNASIEILLAAGAYINSKTEVGVTPLVAAKIAKKKDAFALLKENGAK